MRSRSGLRSSLTLTAVVGAAIALAVLIAAFNLVLDARLREDGDNLLRERAAAVLRGLGSTGGRLVVIEAPDQGAADTQTWIFAAGRAVEQPTGVDTRNQAAAESLSGLSGGFATVSSTSTRMEAVPVTQGSHRLGTVVIAYSLAPYRSTARSALVGSLILGALTLASIAALARWLVHRALRPVAKLTSEAAAWGEHDLSRRFFPGDPHDELTTLASVFDGLLYRLGQSLRRERDLTAEVSHELRTPLAKILAEAELAGRGPRTPEEYRATLELIGSYAKDLQRVLETLLASARAASPGERAFSDAEEVARRALAPLGEGLAGEGKTVLLTAPRPVRLAVHADLAERILSPLLENAARFARERITVQISSADGTATIEIRDDGPGVQAGDSERIFQPGFRGDAAAEEHPGAGLGLALVRRLARTAGGDVEARSSAEGGDFAVRLPAG
jgi:signal transduction histidine kinase